MSEPPLKPPSKKQQAINALEQELARKNARDRKADTRRKILVGAMILKRMENEPKLKKKVMADLDKYLDKEMDRKLFDLN